MRRLLRVSPAALSDHGHVAADNPGAADALMRRMQQRIGGLESRPFIGRARPELRSDLRSLVVGSYLVFYMVTNELVEVVRVLHGARDLPRILRPRLR
jgi:toxin ParE1/3/4